MKKFLSDENTKDSSYEYKPDIMMVKEPEVAYNSTDIKGQGEYTIDDYYILSEDKRMELIDGVIYDMTSPLLIHQILQLEISHHIRNLLDKKGGPCRVFISPADVKLGDDNKTILQPDIFILCDSSKKRRWGIEGAPDFILEILSPSTRRKDMTVKLEKYRKCGVREYWMLDIENRRIVSYYFEKETFAKVLPLSGKAGLSIYDGEIFLDLDRIAAEIDDAETIEAE